MPVYNSLVTRTDVAPLIPEEVSSRMLAEMPNQSAVLGSFTSIPISRAQVRFPVLQALPVAYFVNGDTGLKQTTEISWDNKYMNVEEIACIVPMPENVLADVDVDIWGQAEPLIRNEISRTLDAAVFFGVNAPGTWPTNIAAAAAAAGNQVVAGTAAAAAGGLPTDFSNLFSTLEEDGYDTTRVIARTTLKGLLRNARNTQGDRFAEVGQNNVWGAEVDYPMHGLWPTGAGSAQAFVLDGMHFVVGVRQDINIKVLTESVIQDNTGAIIYNLPQQDMIATRVTFRVAWQVSNPINYDQPVEASRYPAGRLNKA